MVKSPYTCGTDCVYPPNCRKTGLCGDEYCTKRCWTCTEHDCTQYCDRCVTHTCKKTEKAPFVCDSCSEKNKKLTKALGIRRFRKLFPVILTDNGRCFKDAMALEYTKNGSPRTKIFYCDPQASWQKPHIEKNHEFIRYVIPRGKTFKGYTQEDMTLIANHINSTTRPGLGYKSPYELVETEEMKKLLEVLNMSQVPADEICLSPKLLSKE